MSATPEAAGTDPRFQTRDWDAALAEINAAQGFEPAAADGEPVRPERDEVPASDRGADIPTAEAGQESPPQDTTDAPPPAEEVSVSKKEWEDIRRKVASYDGNVQQWQRERQELQGVIDQFRRGNDPLREQENQRIREEARREGERAAINGQIRQIADPEERRQWEARYKAEWDAEDRQLAAERSKAEAEQIRAQADQQIQQAQHVTNYAQAQMVATNMGQYLESFTPAFAAKAGQLLGGEVAEDEIKAFVTRPEIVELAAQAAYQGPAAVNQFGEMLARHAAIHVRDQRQAKETAAKAKREERDQAGLGRDQGGANGRATVDIDQYKSSPTKAGNWDEMLKAISAQQGIATARR